MATKKRRIESSNFLEADSDEGRSDSEISESETEHSEEELELDSEKDEQEESGKINLVSKKRSYKSMEEEEDLTEEPDEEQDEQNDSISSSSKVTPLSKEELENDLKKIKKTGVIYLARIPPYMKPIKMRQILSSFGEVNRIFLSPEDPKVYARRVKYGGNKKKKYTEGWAEFVKKKDAKLAAETLNGNTIGGRKGSYYYDDILSVKYLSKFKWNDLTEQIALENQARQEKMKAEIAQATRENKIFIENVEKQKMISKIKEKRKATGKPVQETVRREFTQREVTSKRADDKNTKKPTGKMSNVLSRIF